MSSSVCPALPNTAFEDAVFAEGWAGAGLDAQYRRGLVYVVGRGADAIHARDRAHRAELEACEHRFGRMLASFPPVVAHRLLLNAPTAAIE